RFGTRPTVSLVSRPPFMIRSYHKKMLDSTVRRRDMLGIRRITRAAAPAPEGEPGSWVSDAARETVMAAYQRAFALGPPPCEELDIETATATTRVHVHRRHTDADPVVLLSMFNAAPLYPYAAALAIAGPVYGIDLPGDPNPSIPRAAMTPPVSCA